MTRRDAYNLIRAVTAALRCRRCEVSLDPDAGLGERSRHRFLHKGIENGSGAHGNHNCRETSYDEDLHSLFSCFALSLAYFSVQWRHQAGSAKA